MAKCSMKLKCRRSARAQRRLRRPDDVLTGGMIGPEDRSVLDKADGFMTFRSQTRRVRLRDGELFGFA
ncbi:hypothetical protein SPHV1_2170005 [Novosphingobium sp. KN65.2]|nr:hypothetical protein SPHV1_2170005 [Novosphingobium sp. KN65.2]